MYQFIDKLHTLYGLLQDEQSKEIFEARLALDIEVTAPHLERLVSAGSFKDQAFMGWLQPLRDKLKKLNEENKKIILYGTRRTGKLYASILQLEHIDFFGFCGRHAERFPDGLFGKPVLSPEELIKTREYYIVLAVGNSSSYPEISKFLQKHNYPQDHILDWIDIASGDCDVEKQYFEFPTLYRRGTAFVDGGCYDCKSSYRFAKWCRGEYSAIIAFEPDPNNYDKCCKNIKETPLPNFQLVNAGLSSQEGTIEFDAQDVNPGGSHIIRSTRDKANISNKVMIRTSAIDDIVGDHTIGFIKMDIEGSELDALHGAKNTILRDKPLLAICVYHLQGDTFAIMDYLHQLLPEYRFLLRHYKAGMEETVLYASVDL